MQKKYNLAPKKKIKQLGLIKYRGVNKFEFLYEFSVDPKDYRSVYFLILPPYYYPAEIKPRLNSANRYNDKIYMTWWFDTDFKIFVKANRNEKKFYNFKLVMETRFLEKNSVLKKIYEEGKDFLARYLAYITGKQ